MTHFNRLPGLSFQLEIQRSTYSRNFVRRGSSITNILIVFNNEKTQ